MADRSNALEEIEIEIRKALSQIADKDMSSVSAETSFRELGFDSMMALEVMAAIERRFKIYLQEEDLRKFTNIRSTVKIIADYLRG